MPNTMVCPKSGWSISSTATTAVSPPVMQHQHPAVRDPCARNDSIHAVATMKKGLRNSDGWRSEMPRSSQRRAPFTSDADDRHQQRAARRKHRRADQREAARSGGRQHRDDDQHRHRHAHPHQLPPEIVHRRHDVRRVRIALRGGGRGRGDRDQPDRDQQHREQQQHAVDFPEPHAQRATVGAAELLAHAAADVAIRRRRSRQPRSCERLDRLAEGVAALLVIAELVERGAGGREQHGVARLGLRGGALHRGFERARIRSTGISPSRSDREQLARLADRIGAHDMAERRAARVEIVGLGLPAEDPVDARRTPRARARSKSGLVALLSLTNSDAVLRRRPAPSGAAGPGSSPAPRRSPLRRCRAPGTRRSRRARSARCAAPAAPASATGPCTRRARSCGDARCGPTPTGCRAMAAEAASPIPITAAWSLRLHREQPRLGRGIALEPVIAVEMVGRDVEQHRDVAIEAEGQVDLIARQFEHIDAALGQRLLRRGSAARYCRPAARACRRSRRYGGSARWWSTCRWCR